MSVELRRSGIEILGEIPWGTHFCQFYRTPADLLDILVPYFAAGLQANEFCMWVTSEPVDKAAAERALAGAVPGFAESLRRGQIEILAHGDWYLAGGRFDATRVLDAWAEKLRGARARGFEGLRLSGNTFWLEKEDWAAFTDYEAAVDKVIGQARMLALCTYSLDKCGANEVLDVVRNHRFALVRREGAWQVIESAERERARLNEQRLAQSLRDSEARYRSLFESLTEGFALYEIIENEEGRAIDWRIVEVNEAYSRHTGVPRDKIAGRRVSELFPATYAEYLPTFARVVATGTPADFETYAKAVDRYMHVVTFPLSGRYFASIIEDISARRKAEEALRIEEERYRALFNNMTEGFALHEIVTDEADRPVDYRFLDINPAFERLTGLQRSQVVGRNVTEVLKGIEPDWIEVYGRVALTGEPLRFERRYPEPLNRWFEIHAYRPAPRQFAVVFTDITQRRKAEEDRKRTESLRRALADQERLRLGAAVELATEAVVMADAGGRIAYVNAAFEALNRIGKGDAVGRNYFEVIGGDPASVGMRAALERGQAWSGQISLERPGERAVRVEVVATPVKDPAGILITERDITQETILQEQVRQSQKMEALGTLAGGIAHDFNNMLGAITINAELALLEAEESCPTRQSLPLVLKAAERGKELVKQIIAFSRQQEWEKNALPIAPVVREALKVFRAMLPEKVEVIEAIGAKDAVVLAHPAQIHQIISNLCQNASLAMKDKPGRLEVRLDAIYVDAAMASRHAGLSPGPHVRLIVSDSGCGMPPEVLDRVFEPFFTTRSPGEGSGLGLSVVHGIVKSYGGAITAYSEPGQGSSFSVFLPLLADAAGKTQAGADAEAAEAGSERVLLVDDDAAQLESLARMLEKLGYKVTARSSGDEAAATFATDPAGFDLVITDQTMARLSGLELARKLVGIRPDIPIILNTGFSEKVNGNTVGQDGIRAFIMKPFTARELSRLIRKVLDS